MPLPEASSTRYCTHPTVNKLPHLHNELTTPNGHSNGGVSLSSHGRIPHKPRRRILRFFFHFALPLPLPLSTCRGLATSNAYTLANGHRGRYRQPQVQHVQPTAYRVLMELPSGQDTLSQSSVARPNRWIRKHSPWSNLQQPGSWSHSISHVPAGPCSSKGSYDRPKGPSYAPAPPGAAYAPATPGAAYAPAPPGASYAPAPSGATYAPLCDLATRSRVVYPTGRGREVESQSHERSARLKPCTRGVGD